MKRGRRHRLGNERGTSLAETMAMAAIMGIIALMLAPTESFLFGRLREAQHVQKTSYGLIYSSARFSADARRARDARVEQAGSVVLSMPGGGEIVWTQTSEGLARIDRTGSPGGPKRRTFDDIASLDVSRPRPNLLAATLRASSGEQRAIEIWLRNAGGR